MGAHASRHILVKSYDLTCLNTAILGTDPPLMSGALDRRQASPGMDEGRVPSSEARVRPLQRLPPGAAAPNCGLFPPPPPLHRNNRAQCSGLKAAL